LSPTHPAGKITQKEYEDIINHTAIDSREDEVRAGKIGSFLGIVGADKANHLQRIAVEETRLGIPLLFGLDVIHGHRTVFPIPLAESCTFSDAAFEKSAEIAAREAAEDGVHWTFAPMIDVSRDPRWGRIAEGPGEDSYLASRYAAAKVKGFQGNELKSTDRVIACAKHYAAYGAAEGGRDYNTADMSLPTLWETYLPPFEAAVKAGAGTVMAAFNDLNGIPCTTNLYLIKTVLREKFGFEGFVISDAHGIIECVAHGTADNNTDAARQAIIAGTDMDMGCELYSKHLAVLLGEGKISIGHIDAAVKNVLRLKFAKGLFETPYFPIPQKSVMLTNEHRESARNIARRSIVLLKNDGLLPLKMNLKLAVVGALADSPRDMLGCWVISGKSEEAVSLISGLKIAGANFIYAPCCGPDTSFDKAEFDCVTANADVVIAAVGERFNYSGEAHSRANIGLPGEQEQMIEALEKSGKPFITVLFNGRPLAIPKTAALSPALVEAWFLGSEAGNAVTDVLFGQYNPSGRLTVTFPHSSGACPETYNHTGTGRPRGEERWTSKYEDLPLTPLFPFGYGLSYTTYEYSDLALHKSNGRLTVCVSVKNTGDNPGEETVQLYVHRRHASRVRPVRELKGLQKVFLEPGETKRVEIAVLKSALGYYDGEMNYITDSSDFDVWVAHDSQSGLHGCINL
ncbi:MAG: glycoside hydrolase family 3 C-terminal domain-containing protein, partial [Oscillospiraceae bacterium]|nr:glycoside hydrolase family 3 C-terminal domain-containing protein [Oscillospiraceae bacterium]